MTKKKKKAKKKIGRSLNVTTSIPSGHCPVFVRADDTRTEKSVAVGEAVGQSLVCLGCAEGLTGYALASVPLEAARVAVCDVCGARVATAYEQAQVDELLTRHVTTPGGDA